jgi:hypothetical protein
MSPIAITSVAFAPRLRTDDRIADLVVARDSTAANRRRIVALARLARPLGGRPRRYLRAGL